MYAPLKPWKLFPGCFAFLLCLCMTTASAQIPPPRYGTYINDLAGILDKDDIADINEQIHMLESSYSVQLAVVLVNKLPDGMSIEDYARRIGRKWHVGINDSGLVYIASIGQHKQRLEVSRELRRVITDSVARDLTDNIKPFFRDNDYAGGLKGMISEIDDHLQMVLNAKAPDTTGQTRTAQAEGQPPLPNTPSKEITLDYNSNASTWDWGIFFVLVLIGGFILVVISAVFRGVRKTRRSGDSNIIHHSMHTPGDPYNVQHNADMVTTAIVAGALLDNPSDPVRHPHIDMGNVPGSDNSSMSSQPGDFGNWGGGGASDPGFSAPDSGFSGAGSTNDW